MIVEVWEKIQPARMEAWTAFARSAAEDTRFAVCLPAATECAPAQQRLIRDKGIGLYLCETDESTHRKLHVRTEKRLRDHVGHHMWAVIEALKELAKQP